MQKALICASVIKFPDLIALWKEEYSNASSFLFDYAEKILVFRYI